jgi:hypothetical protein
VFTTDIFTPVGKLVRLLTFSGLFFAAGVWMLGDATGLYDQSVAILAIAFGGLCGLYFGFRLLFRAPVLEVDADGIVDRSSLVSPGRLRWDEIDSVRIYTFSTYAHGRTIEQRMLGIHPRHGSDVVRRTNPVKRVLMRINGRLVATPINIPESVLPGNLEELVDQMRQYCPTLEVRD